MNENVIHTLDLNVIRTLITIEDANSFSGAAKLLFKTQPTITQQMQRLERQIGKPLFEKKGRGRTLTPEGQQLATYGRRLLAINDEALRTVGQNHAEGEIRVGAPLDIADTILPPILTYIARQEPKVRLEIRVDRSPFLMEALQSGDIDLTVSTRNNPEFSGFALRTSPTAWICAADYIYNRHAPLRLIVSDERSIFRRIALDALENTGINWRINYLAPTLVAIKAAVRAGLGVTARSTEFLGADMRVISTTDGLPELPPMTYWLWVRNDTVNPLTLHIYDLLKSKFQQQP